MQREAKLYKRRGSPSYVHARGGEDDGDGAVELRVKKEKERRRKKPNKKEGV